MLGEKTFIIFVAVALNLVHVSHEFNETIEGHMCVKNQPTKPRFINNYARSVSITLKYTNERKKMSQLNLVF